MTARKLVLEIGTVLGLVVAMGVAQAQEDEGYDFKFFAGGAYIQPLNDTQLFGATVEASNEVGIELAGEFKVSDRVGIEVAYLDANQDIEINGTAIGDIDLQPWNFTLDFHIVSKDAFIWYVGPTLSYIDWSDISFQGGGSLDIESETTWGVSTGFVIGLGDTFGIELGVRYIDSTIESPLAPGEVAAVDPLFARVGVSFRF